MMVTDSWRRRLGRGGSSAARRYGKALFQLAQKRGETEKIRGELAQLEDLLAQNRAFAQLLDHPLIPPPAKKAALSKALGEGFSREIVSFLSLLSDRRRERLLPEIVAVYKELGDAARGVLEVEAQSAVPLEAREMEALRQTIERACGKEVRLVPQVVPGLLGGLRLRLGDRVLDGSLAGGLRQLGTRLRESGLGGL